MVKKQVMISVDSTIHSKCKSKGLCISALCEDALRNAVILKKSDLPEASLKLKCSICSAVVDDGFYCELTKRVTCESCEKAQIKTAVGIQTKYPCLRENHLHLKIPGFNGENSEIVQRLNSNNA